MTTNNPSICHISFYKFVKILRVDEVVECVRQISFELTGSILIAEEGINGVIAGSVEQVDAFETALKTNPVFDNCFADMVFKRSLCSKLPFGRIKVHKKAEIVALGVDGIETVGKPGIQLTPEQWRALLQEDDVVVIDNRNSFEYRLGHFKQAVDPGVTHFRDFPAYIENNLEQWKTSGKKVAMYCTGGIRCEKTSAWLEARGLPVYQLEGGILNYFQQMPDAEKDWQGECFVFDNRIAIDTKLQETGLRAEDVYDETQDGQWRLQRAKRLSKSDES